MEYVQKHYLTSLYLKIIINESNFAIIGNLSLI